MEEETVQAVDEIRGAGGETRELGEVEHVPYGESSPESAAMPPQNVNWLTKFARAQRVFAFMMPNSGPYIPADAGGAK